MFKRTTTLITLLLLVITPLASFLNVKALADGTPRSTEEQCKAKVELMAQEMHKSATYDKSGRVSSALLPVSSNEKLRFVFEYDKQGRLRAVTGEDGSQTQFEYDNAGQLHSLLLSTGVRLTYRRDSNGEITGVDRQAAPSKPGITKVHMARLVGVSATLMTSCDEATKQATLAVIAAGTICVASGIISPACAGALAAAAYLTYLAKQACSSEVQPIENAV